MGENTGRFSGRIKGTDKTANEVNAEREAGETQAETSTEVSDATQAAAPAADAPAKGGKSIVPSKYGNKYRNGGSDALATFINEQASGKEGFEYPAFFQLCRKNGIPEDKVAHYEGLVTAKVHGAQGRARMTLRNMLATIARKNGKLVGLNDAEVAIDLPKPTVSGAAAKAQETAAAAAGETQGEDASQSSGSEL